MRYTYTIIGLTRRVFSTQNMVCISIILMASQLSKLSYSSGQYPEIWHLVAMPGSQPVCARNPTDTPDIENYTRLRGNRSAGRSKNIDMNIIGACPLCRHAWHECNIYTLKTKPPDLL
jgi:hypothetical protein